MQKYLDRIAVLSARKTAGSYNHLTPNQKYLFNVIERLSQSTDNQRLERREIQYACGPTFDFNNRGNLITDFCYNKVNLEDSENKFLVSLGRGAFHFVGFDWMNHEAQQITWKVADLREKFTVGTYREGKFFWQFDTLLQRLMPSADTLAEEVIDPERFPEGTVKRISVNAYERNADARQRCINYHGTSCYICGFNFYTFYGEIGKGFIHVHHLTPLAQIGQAYQVNPITDLIPVCPNCHAILHRRNPPYTVEEVKQMLPKIH